MKNIFFLSIFVLALTSCKKENNDVEQPAENTDSTETPTVNLGDTSSTLLMDSLNQKTLLPNGINYHIQLNAGTLYELKWYDGWWTPDYEGSVWMTGYHQDLVNKYFNTTRLIQMTGAPKILQPTVNETFYLNAVPYDTYPYGVGDTINIGIEIRPINTANSVHLDMNTPKYVVIPIGTTKLYDFDVLADSTYHISLTGSDSIGAYGDQAELFISAFGESSMTPYWFEQYAGNTYSGGPNVIQITPTVSEKIHITATAAWWFESRTLTIEVMD